MNIQWIEVPESDWDLNRDAVLRDLEARGFVPTTDPPTTERVIERDAIKIEVKVVESS